MQLIIQTFMLVLSIILLIIGSKCIYFGGRMQDTRLTFYGISILLASCISFPLFFLKPTDQAFEWLGISFIAASIFVRYLYDKYRIKEIFHDRNIKFIDLIYPFLKK